MFYKLIRSFVGTSAEDDALYKGILLETCTKLVDVCYLSSLSTTWSRLIDSDSGNETKLCFLKSNNRAVVTGSAFQRSRFCSDTEALELTVHFSSEFNWMRTR